MISITAFMYSVEQSIKITKKKKPKCVGGHKMTKNNLLLSYHWSYMEYVK